MKEAVDDIMVTLNEAASEGGMVGGMVESIAEAMGRVSKAVVACAMTCWDMFVSRGLVKASWVRWVDFKLSLVPWFVCLKAHWAFSV